MSSLPSRGRDWQDGEDPADDSGSSMTRNPLNDINLQPHDSPPSPKISEVLEIAAPDEGPKALPTLRTSDASSDDSSSDDISSNAFASEHADDDTGLTASVTSVATAMLKALTLGFCLFNAFKCNLSLFQQAMFCATFSKLELKNKSKKCTSI